MDTPHCTQVLMGLGQPFPLTVMPSSSSLNEATSAMEQIEMSDSESH